MYPIPQWNYFQNMKKCMRTGVGTTANTIIWDMGVMMDSYSGPDKKALSMNTYETYLDNREPFHFPSSVTSLNWS